MEPTRHAASDAGTDAAVDSHTSSSSASRFDTQASRNRVVGVLVDPVEGPADIAGHLADEIAGRLASELDEVADWEVVTHREQLPAGRRGAYDEIMNHGRRRMDELGWDLLLCVTELPLAQGSEPAVVAEASVSWQMAVVSLPGFGALRARRRVIEVATALTVELAASVAAPPATAPGPRPALPRGFNWTTPDDAGIDLRIRASRGRSRKLAGMVRTNRPWRLVFRLRGAIVGAFAFTAFFIINATLWKLSAAHGPARLLLLSLGTITAFVVWLIAYHNLWLPKRELSPGERDQVTMYNASTILTLALGVSIAYLALLAINFSLAQLVIADQVLGQELGRQAGLADYLMIAWLASSGGAIAGGLGTGFDSEGAVRRAAYSPRAQERRSELQRRSDEKQPEEGAGPAEGG